MRETIKYKEKALKAIKKHSLFRLCDIPRYVNFSRATLFVHKLHEDEEIKEALDDIKTEEFIAAKKDLRESKAPACIISRMKIFGGQEVWSALSGEKIEEETASDDDTKKDIEEGLKEIRERHEEEE